MKNAGFAIICCILSVFLIPMLFLSGNEEPLPTAPVAAEKISVYDHEKDTVFDMDFEEYVWRVIAREMSYSYEIEALKAQAVAARTYTLRRMQNPEPPEEHKGAQICTNPAHCSAFMTEENARAQWGDRYDEIRAKFQQAAEETRGEIVTYENQPAATVFHAMSSGSTEYSKDVWGGDLPYLVSVDSEVDKQAEGYETTVTFTLADFADKMGVEIPDNHGQIIGDIAHTEGGSVDTIQFCGTEFKGTEVRSALNLRSANFVPKIDGDSIIFTVYGYGHGVGMSQTGANAYAAQGYSYRDILAKYYPGTELIKTN